MLHRRALAQKISIRLSKHFARHRLVEVNSHNLFSKYFSESGKLVGKLFDEILDMLADPELFVVVLIGMSNIRYLMFWQC